MCKEQNSKFVNFGDERQQNIPPEIGQEYYGENDTGLQVKEKYLHHDKYNQYNKNFETNEQKPINLEEIGKFSEVFQGIYHTLSLTFDNISNSIKSLYDSFQKSLSQLTSQNSEINYLKDHSLDMANIIMRENNLTAQKMVEEREEFYFKYRINRANRMFVGFSKINNQEMVGVFIDKTSKEYLLYIFNKHYISNTYMKIYFNISLYNLNLKAFKSQYKICELYEDIDEQNTIFSVAYKYSGSLSNFIQIRKSLKKPLSTVELQWIFISLETLNLYHSNLKITKFLLSFTQNGELIENSFIVLNQLEKLHYIKPNYNDKDLIDLNNIQSDTNGYSTPEAKEFSSQLYASKQNSYVVGLIMLNLIILEEFTMSRFQFNFRKGVNSLENDEISDELRIVDQDQRFTCKQIIKEIFGIEFKSLEDQHIKNEVIYIDQNIQPQDDLSLQISETSNIDLNFQSFEDQSIKNYEINYNQNTFYQEDSSIQPSETSDLLINSQDEDNNQIDLYSLQNIKKEIFSDYSSSQNKTVERLENMLDTQIVSYG